MKKKKVLATLMALTLTASMCPLTTYAANIQADAVETENSGEAEAAEAEAVFAEGEMNAEESGEVLTDIQTEENADTEESGKALNEEIRIEENADTEESGEVPAEEINTVNIKDTIAVEEETSADNALDAVGTEAAGTWVLMNIPYDDFYSMGMKNNNTATVDAFSSATKVKVRNAGMANGSYHVDKGSGEGSTTDINGVTFPVWVASIDDLRGLSYTEIKATDKKNVEVADGKTSTKIVEYTGKDILFAEPDYSYCVLTNSEWNSNEYKFYAKASISDGKVSLEGMYNKDGKQVSDSDITTIKDSGYTFKTTSTWGDYELDLSTGVTGDDITDFVKNGTTDVYGIVITAVDGSGEKYDYPLRHIENMWMIYELSWNTGFSTEVHGCKVTSDLYMSLPGQSISYVTYYTNAGIYKVQLCDKNGQAKTEKVLKKYNIEVPAAAVSTGTTTLKLTDVNKAALDAFSDPVITVDKSLAGGNYQDGKITWTANSALPGSYTITVADNGGNYAELSAELLLSTNTAAAAYDANKGKLVAASGSSAANLANYLKNITSVTVGGNKYSVSGRGAVKVINDDGSINWDVKSANKAVFENGKTYTAVVESSGYPNLTFTVSKLEVQKSWISSIAAQTYTGAAHTPQVTVKNGNQTLTKDVDYKISYTDNINAGAAKVTVTGLGKYYGTVSTTFTINQAASSVTLKNKTVTYNGRAVAIDKANVTGSKGSITYKYYSDKNCTRSVSAANVKNAGTYYVKASVAAAGNYKAATSASATLTINKAASTVTLANKTVTATGKKITMSGAKVTGSSGKITYKYYSNKSCTKAVSASKVKNAGTYYVKATVAADTNYKTATSKAAKLVIKPAQTITYKKTSATYKASALKSGKKTFKIGAASKQKGKISYTKASNTRKTLSVDKNGKVTVKKGLKKGTYTLKVKVTAAAKGSYGKTTVTKTVKVKVK